MDFILGLLGKYKMLDNPGFGNPDVKGMYRVFHSTNPKSSRLVEMPDTPKELFVIGRIPSIPYIPYGSSGKDKGAIYVHKFGDYGNGRTEFDKDHMPLLAADDKDNLYIIKDRASYVNEARGIVG